MLEPELVGRLGAVAVVSKAPRGGKQLQVRCCCPVKQLRQWQWERGGLQLVWGDGGQCGGVGAPRMPHWHLHTMLSQQMALRQLYNTPLEGHAVVLRKSNTRVLCW